MPTLRIQNLKIDSDTKKITSGTASIKESRYLQKEKWIQSKDSSLSEIERIRAKEMSQKINAAWETVKKFRDI